MESLSSGAATPVASMADSDATGDAAAQRPPPQDDNDTEVHNKEKPRRASATTSHNASSTRRRKKDDDKTNDKPKEKKPRKEKDKDKEKPKEKPKEKDKPKDTDKPKDKEKDDKDKDSKPRSRRSREKNGSISSQPASRKKPKLEHDSAQSAEHPATTVAAASGASTASPAPSRPPSAPLTPPTLSQNGNREAIPTSVSHPLSSSFQAPTSRSMHPLASTVASHAPLPTAASSSSSNHVIPSHTLPRPSSQPLEPPAYSSPPRTSGQIFDPIRSAVESPAPPPQPTSHTHSPQRSGLGMASTDSYSNHHYSPPKPSVSPHGAFRASASPAISSIIDPPEAPHPQHLPPPRPSSSMEWVPKTSTSMPAWSGQHAGPSNERVHTERASTPQWQPSSSHQSPQQSHREPVSQPRPSEQPPKDEPLASSTQQPTEMDTGPDGEAAPAPSKPSKKEKSTATGQSTTGSSPKPSRTKEAKDAPQPPPLPQGSGLITGALFGVDDSSAGSKNTAPNIVLHIPLRGESNKIISFAQLAEEKYGFAALHPRVAAHKQRLARVAAASAALEKADKKGSGVGESAEEDLSVDADNSDADGDVTMGGMGATDAEPEQPVDGKRKRRRKMEDYDRDDPFVDDSELAWQEHAAASKDGFFVYSGPLVPEGDKVEVERYVILSLSCGLSY